MMALSCDILLRNSLKQIMELPLHLDNLKSEFHIHIITIILYSLLCIYRFLSQKIENTHQEIEIKEEPLGKRTIKFPSQEGSESHLSCLNETNRESRTMLKQNYNDDYNNDKGGQILTINLNITVFEKLKAFRYFKSAGIFIFPEISCILSICLFSRVVLPLTKG